MGAGPATSPSNSGEEAAALMPTAREEAVAEEVAVEEAALLLLVPLIELTRGRVAAADEPGGRVGVGVGAAADEAPPLAAPLACEKRGDEVELSASKSG